MKCYILLSILLILPFAVFGSSAREMPNIIFIFADDLGYGDLSCYGSKTIRSPQLDQMGSYPGRVGMDNVLMPGNKDKRTGEILGLNPAELTLAEVVKSQGYATACIGKWHLGDAPIFMPNNHGFDEFFGLPYSNDMVPPRFVDLPLMRNGEVLELNPDQDYLTKRYTEESISFIERNQEKPFFLYLSHSMPHRPCHASPEFTKRFKEKQLKSIKANEDKGSRDFLYPASVEEVDWSAGEILKKLKELGLEENTLVIFTSDNGPKTGSAGSLKGSKGSVYEGGHRVPAIMQWKGKIPAGSVNREIVTGMDFLPTFAALVGTDLPTDRVLDGHNILPLLEGEAEATSGYEAFFYTKLTALIDAFKVDLKENSRPAGTLK